jgi:hypothetical protein
MSVCECVRIGFVQCARNGASLLTVREQNALQFASVYYPPEIPTSSPVSSEFPRRSPEGHRALAAAECQSEGGGGEAHSSTAGPSLARYAIPPSTVSKRPGGPHAATKGRQGWTVHARRALHRSAHRAVPALAPVLDVEVEFQGGVIAEALLGQVM